MTPTPPLPHEAEPVAVQLARMEGKIDLYGERVTGLVERVNNLDSVSGAHDLRLVTIELGVQRLGDAMAANEKTVAMTALALKDAKEQAEATARAEVAKQAAELTKSELAWTPMTRLAVTVATVTSAIGAFAVFAK